MIRLVFTGIDGAGKSTQLARAAERLARRGVTARRHDKWDVLDRGQFPEARFVRAPAEDLRRCIAEMEGPSRALFLGWLIAATLRDLDACDVDLIDGHWYKHAAAELALGCPHRLLDAIGAALPPPDHVLYLRATPEVALARKPALTRYECGRDPALSPARFLGHQRRIQSILDDWAARRGWAVVDADRDLERVAVDVDRWVDRRIAGRAGPPARSGSERP